MRAQRMILELPTEIQMAIRLRAVKAEITYGEVVAIAIQSTFPQDVKEAGETIAARNQE